MQRVAPNPVVSDRRNRPFRRAGSAGSRKSCREAWVAYAFIAPALIFYVGFLALPTLGTVAISFFDWTGTTFSQMDWTGLSNYQRLATDPVFKEALLHNVIFVLVGASGIVLLGLVLAVLLEQGLRGSGVFRAVFFIPSVLSLVVVSLVFVLIASPELGLINPILGSLGLGSLQRAWLGDPQTALGSVIAGAIWRDFGFAMLIFIAGLRALNMEIFEAARLDGAKALQTFTRITVPLLKPVIVTVTALITIGLLKVFDQVYLMTHGGPDHSSEVLSTWMYQQAFSFNKFGYGAAIAVFLLLATVVVGVAQLWLGREES